MNQQAKMLFSFACPTLEVFDNYDRRAHEIGATHELLTADLPNAVWQ